MTNCIRHVKPAASTGPWPRRPSCRSDADTGFVEDVRDVLSDVFSMVSSDTSSSAAISQACLPEASCRSTSSSGSVNGNANRWPAEASPVVPLGLRSQGRIGRATCSIRARCSSSVDGVATIAPRSLANGDPTHPPAPRLDASSGDIGTVRPNRSDCRHCQRKSRTASAPATAAYTNMTRRSEAWGVLPVQLSESAWTAAPAGV